MKPVLESRMVALRMSSSLSRAKDRFRPGFFDIPWKALVGVRVRWGRWQIVGEPCHLDAG